MSSVRFLFSGLVLIVTALASPIEQRAAATTQAIPSRITSPAQLNSIISGLEADGTELALGASVFLDLASAIVPAPNPTAIAAEISSVASVYKAHPTFAFESALNLISAGLTPTDAYDLLTQSSPIENSSDNNNSINPSPPVYPSAAKGDAPYSQSEKKLRSALYIPRGFTYGKVPPLIFVPGTGATAYSNFIVNFGKIFQGSSYADAVYLNIPNNQLGELQQNSEYVAYAINYISAISGHKNVSLLTWSAGSVDTVWAHQYWPSTRNITSDLVSISGDRHGTVLAYLTSPGFPPIAEAPAIIQQEYNSKFISTLRNGGGSSAYVPTTSIYSIFDQIVQPQEGTGASAYVQDARGVGATNIEIQSTCSLFQPAGTLYAHEGVLYNALAVAAAIDALTHDGPADLSRIDVAGACQQIADHRLSLADVLATEALIPIAVLETVAYPNKTTVEPPIMPYAQKDTPAGM